MTDIAAVTPTADVNINGVLYGYKWAVTSLTFSFPSSGSFYGEFYGSNENITGFAQLNATQQAAVRSILTSYEAIANLSFTEITETATQHADLRYATSSLPSTAWAYVPIAYAEGGDAWFGIANNWYVNPVVGNYAWTTFIHETGHALGLKHPQTASGAFGAMPAEHDSLEYTVMSYRSYINGPMTGYTVEGSGFPQTLMMYDVAGIQAMYGANYATNSGDTVYAWNPLTGQQTINGVAQTAASANRILMNVWDGGGRDTYDFSSYTAQVKVNLAPGGWTITSADQLSTLAPGHIATGNISNSLLYQDNIASLIENAIGGSGDDIITGNIANNWLKGGAGSDALNGDAGIDRALYSGRSSDYQLVHNANDTWTVTDLRGGSPDGTDTLTSIELAQFSDLLLLLNTMLPVPPLQVPTFTSFGSDSGTPGDRITNDNTLTFTGTGTAGSTVSIFRGGVLLGTAAVDGGGTWVFTTGALANGAHSFTANAMNIAGDTSAATAAYVVTVDTVAPNTPVISGYTPDSHILGDGWTNATTLTLTGTAEANSVVHVFDGATLLGTTTATAAGAWNFRTYDPAMAAPALACACPACAAAALAAEPGAAPQSGDGISGVLSDGSHAFSIRSVDAAGNISAASAVRNVNIDTIAPAVPSILSFSPDSGNLGDGRTKAQVLTLAGTTEALGTVQIFDGAILLGTATATGTGSWSFATPALSYATHSFTAKAIDNAGNTSAASNALTVIVDANAPNAVNHLPAVTAANVSASRGQGFAASALFTVTDADYDPITRYQIYDSNGAANSGYFVVNGVAKQGPAIITVTAAELAQTSFVAGAGAETLMIMAFDGIAWGGWTSFTVTSPNALPIITPTGTTVFRNQSVAASSLFTATDADNDAITQYQLWDGTSAATSGRFVVNGVAQAAGVAFTVTSAQLAQTTFAAGTTADSLLIRAFDGMTWGAWTSVSVTPAVSNAAPVVTASNVSAARNQSLAASSLFSATDPEGNPITQYQFQDGTAGATTGYFSINGTAQAAETVLTVSAAQLAQTNFIAGAGTDSLMVRAFDGVVWSGWTSFSVTGSNAAPVVTATGTTVAQGQNIAASSLFSASDPDSDAITQYQLQDNTPGGTSGYFTVNGVTQLAQTLITISAAQLAQTNFIAGSGMDSLTVRAFDGVAWSGWTPFNVTGSAANAAPVVTASNVTAPRNQSLAASALFSVTDPESDPITQYQFQDSTTGATSGYFTLNGVVQAAATPFTVSSAQLAQTGFVVGATADSLMVRAFDGTAWSDWDTFTVTPTNLPPVATVASISAPRNQNIAVSSLFSVNDPDNNPITQYQFQDNTTAATSGVFKINGVAQATASPITVTADQLAQTSFTVGTTADSLMVRAFDGIAWSTWATFSITPVNALPVVTASNVTATARGQSFATSSLFSTTDANNDAITQYQVYDSTPAAISGYFVLNGVAQTAPIITISASQLPLLSFVAGAGADALLVHAFDGTAWGNWTSFTVTGPNSLPVVTATAATALPGQSLAVSSLFSAIDPDSDVITQYRFWDGSSGQTSGYFTVNGVVQAAMTTPTVAAAQLSQVNFVAGSVADSLLVQAFDGAGWSAWTPLRITVSASTQPPAAAATLNGTPNAETITSTPAREIMVGGAGNDTFVFPANFGHDVIKDFQTAGDGHDSIAFSQSVFRDAADILAHAVQSGADVVITADAGNSVTLQNTSLNALQQHPNDFLLVIG